MGNVLAYVDVPYSSLCKHRSSNRRIPCWLAPLSCLGDIGFPILLRFYWPLSFCRAKRITEFNIYFAFICGRGWTNYNLEKNTFFPLSETLDLTLFQIGSHGNSISPQITYSLPLCWPGIPDYPTGPCKLLTSSSTTRSFNSLKIILLHLMLISL